MDISNIMGIIIITGTK